MEVALGFAETVLLGAIAGSAIFIGLPVGRVRHLRRLSRVALAMFSVGILAFVFVDVSGHAEELVSTALQNFKDGNASFADVLGVFGLLAVGFTAGTVGISATERALQTRRPSAVAIGGGGGRAAPLGPEDPSSDELQARRAALGTGMRIATAIGLHNFAEGLAIGVSAKAGAIGLETVLIIGFGLHNATEGFGIVGPLGTLRPSWRWLGLAGLVGGAPTFVGTILGYQVHSGALELCFYALAGGAILYVIGEIWASVHRQGHRTLGLALLALGFLIGVATDLVVTYGGG